MEQEVLDPPQECRRVRDPQLSPGDIERVRYPLLQLLRKTDNNSTDIAKKVSERTRCQLKREHPFRILCLGLDQGWLWYCPPRNVVLSERLRDQLGHGEVHVADTGGMTTPSSVPTAAAVHVHGLIREIAASQQRPVHIALGVGQATRHFVEALAGLFCAHMDRLSLVIHGLAAESLCSSYEGRGCSHQDTPRAFADVLATRTFVEVRFVPLGCEALVPAERYAELRKHVVLQEAFAGVEEIDISVNSIGDFSHGYLQRYLENFNSEGLEWLVANGFVGDYQLNGYSPEGPLEIDRGMKPVTLLDIGDFVKMASDERRHVVLMCAPCVICGKRKVPSLMPLLLKPSLCAWNVLFLDVETALDVHEELRLHLQGSPQV